MFYIQAFIIILFCKIMLCIGILSDISILNNPYKLKSEKRLQFALMRTRRGLGDDRSVPTENLKGRPGQGYYITVEIGTPPQRLNVLVDTGSSNFAVATQHHPFLSHFFHLNESSTYIDYRLPIDVPYTQGNWQGQLGSDVIRFIDAPNATLRVDVATIMSSQNFFINGSSWQGILGLGYAHLSKPDSSVITVFDEFVRNNVVDNMFSMQLCSSSVLDPSDEPNMAGTMIFGSNDNNLYRGEIFYTPIVKKWYYEVVITDFLVNKETLGLNCKKYNYDKTIVDSGTTNLRVPEEVFTRILVRLKKYDLLGVPDDFWIGRQMMCWDYDKTPWEEFPDLSISFSSSISSRKEFTLKIPPQLYLRETIEHGPLDGQHCYKFAITKTEKGTVIGAVIMEGFYVVFDRINSRVGFAATTCGSKGRLNPNSDVFGPYIRQNPIDCQYVESEASDSALLLVIYIMASTCSLCLLPALILLVQSTCMDRYNVNVKLPT